jgi:hypothetical protein
VKVPSLVRLPTRSLNFHKINHRKNNKRIKQSKQTKQSASQLSFRIVLQLLLAQGLCEISYLSLRNCIAQVLDMPLMDSEKAQLSIVLKAADSLDDALPLFGQ